MKKLLFTLIFSLFFLSLSAQNFEIVSVESLPADMSAREEMKTDHNDRQCALLRIATQNIAPNQREAFSFVPDLGSEVVERATRDGEIWLWVSPGLKYLRIKHPDWGQYELRLIDHVTRVESLHTYKVTIKGTSTIVSQDDYDIMAWKGDVYYDAKNYEEALKCYQEAAEHGNAVGQNGMGRLYITGSVVQQDYSKAFQWFNKAAEQNDARAQANLGLLYYRGQGVAQDFSMALQWFRKAVEQDNAMAQASIGVMYQFGHGVSSDYF